MANIYYNPEQFGLEQIAHLELAGNYDFDTFVAWKDADGAIYWAHDDGCSCPTPFEDFKSTNDLHAIRKWTDLEELDRELGKRAMDGYKLELLQEFRNAVRLKWSEWSRARSKIVLPIT